MGVMVGISDGANVTVGDTVGKLVGTREAARGVSSVSGVGLFVPHILDTARHSGLPSGVS